MPKTTFTYHQLDERLRALGFTVHTQKGKARIYRHEQTGVRIFLPDVSLNESVLPYHLAVARHFLEEYNLGDIWDTNGDAADQRTK